MNGRFDRLDPAAARDPVKGMRVYGRGRTGVGVVVIHEVVDGKVYFARRVRGGRVKTPWRGWTLSHNDLSAWQAGYPDVAAVRLPRPPGGLDADARRLQQAAGPDA